MRRLAELSVFLPLAAGLHVAAFGLAAGPQGAPGGGGGEGGAALVTLAAAPPALSRLAEEWTAPPEVQTAAPEPVVPTHVTAPRSPDPEARPAPPVALPSPEAPGADAAPAALSPPPAIAPPPAETAILAVPPAPGRADDAPLPPDMPPRPEGLRAPDAPPVEPPMAAPRPERRPEAAPPPAPAQTARGTERAPQAGAPARAAPALSEAAARALHAEWGGRILARVSRVHRYPRETRATGRALVELVVTREGALVSARLVQSAGDPALDRAALAAVRRAGPFPTAPRGLDRASYSFTLPLKFDGRR
ncbi:TonB family protein [Rhodovulum tesquicola]|uniref:TonB family protein n=1 Tax=Rhodovulum tesquicola TaxID=540254 RepID=UPI002097E917|nr:TonB family protein [Rhodovulum tesquicola]MCO8145429.1 TonB family protein [Rhodovulum tesquicola]